MINGPQDSNGTCTASIVLENEFGFSGTVDHSRADNSIGKKKSKWFRRKHISTGFIRGDKRIGEHLPQRTRTTRINRSDEKKFGFHANPCSHRI